MSDFLLELLSEEMPASLIEDSAVSIERILFNNIKKNNLIFDKHNFYFGPKRLTFIFHNLKTESPLYCASVATFVILLVDKFANKNTTFKLSSITQTSALKENIE